MLRPLTTITIEQQKTTDFPDRARTIALDYCHSYEITSTWSQHTDTAKITFPKNVQVRDSLGNKYSISGTNTNIGGGTNTVNAPLFLRGDKVTIQGGYIYPNAQGATIQQVHLLFSGWISKVHSGIPVELECEDNMWKLKQVHVPDKHWSSKSYNMITMLREMLTGTGFTLSEKATTTADYSLGSFVTRGDTVVKVLKRLKDDHGMESFFRDGELHIGYPIYDEPSAQSRYFIFQKNIIDSSIAQPGKLQYERKDDVTISMTATSVYSENTGQHTKDGNGKTKYKRLEILVYRKDNGFTYDVKEPGQDTQESEEGEKYTYLANNITDAKKLYAVALPELQKHYYTGFRGSFTTFGVPNVRWGDNANIIDPVLPDRTGQYKIKKVVYKGGYEGMKQEIYLDYKTAATVEMPAKGTLLI